MTIPNNVISVGSNAFKGYSTITSVTWGTKLQTIVNINERIEKGNLVDFIQMCEAKHNKMLAELGDLIQKDIENIIESSGYYRRTLMNDYKWEKK